MYLDTEGYPRYPSRIEPSSARYVNGFQHGKSKGRSEASVAGDTGRSGDSSRDTNGKGIAEALWGRPLLMMMWGPFEELPFMMI